VAVPGGGGQRVPRRACPVAGVHAVSRLPLLATTLRLLAAHGPHGPVWWRYGYKSWQPLVEALDNPDDYRAYSVRDEARRKAQEAEYERRQREREERSGPASRRASGSARPASGT
jgi:hypothetical protein